MSFIGVRFVVVLLCVGALMGGGAMGFGASAQAQGSNPDQKPPEKSAGDAGKADAEKKKIDVIVEAAKRLAGTAANPECTWIGVRVARLLYQDDLDTAFRHLDIYDRFGCPGNHIQATFRCLAKQPEINPKTDTLTARVNDCWLDPTGSSATTAPQSPAAPAASTTPTAPSAPNGSAGQ